MPFGIMFAGLVIGGLFPWYGATRLTDSGSVDWIVGAAWALTGAVIGFGLLTRRRWFRAIGLAASAILMVEGLMELLTRGDVIDHVLIVAGLAAFVLLAIPATGRAAAAAAPEASRRDGVAPALVAAAGVVALTAQVAIGAAGSFSPVAATPTGQVNPPEARPHPGRFGTASLASMGTPPQSAEPSAAAAARSDAIEWASFAKGLVEAKSRRTPMFVEFYATWCGACKSLDRNAFRDAGVARKLREIVAVRVNAEEQTPRDGLKGVELANQFQVEAYPTLLVLDSKGKELARLVGAPDPRGFLRWLENAIAGESRAGGSLEPGVRVARN